MVADGIGPHARARSPRTAAPTGRAAGMPTQLLAPKEAHVSTLTRRCTAGMSPSNIPVHEHLSTSKRHRERRISALLRHGAAPTSHGSRPDAKVAARSKLWVANNDLRPRGGIRGGTRQLEAHQALKGRPRHGLALKAGCSGRVNVARVQGGTSRPHTSSWYSPLRRSPARIASARRQLELLRNIVAIIDPRLV